MLLRIYSNSLNLLLVRNYLAEIIIVLRLMLERNNVWRVKRSALRLRLTGSVVQPLSFYDLLTYKAIGSNYLSFVVTSMLVFHIATG